MGELGAKDGERKASESTVLGGQERRSYFSKYDHDINSSRQQNAAGIITAARSGVARAGLRGGSYRLCELALVLAWRFICRVEEEG